MRNLFYFMWLLASGWCCAESASDVDRAVQKIIPPAPLTAPLPEQPAIVVMAEAPQSTVDLTVNLNTSEIIVGGGFEVCQDVESADGLERPSAFNSLSVLNPVFSSFGYKIEGGYYNAPADVREKILNAKVAVVELPMHGSVDRASPASVHWKYRPDSGYKGTDRVTFVVEVLGKRFTYTYNLLVHEVAPEDSQCESVFPDGKAPAVTTPESLLQIPSSIKITINNLVAGAVAVTAGNEITLDDNAAGNNWYTNWETTTDWLPTSNPYEWKAREGSEAFGKMDLLSVMLHEYGHVLGIEHSADSRDYDVNGFTSAAGAESAGATMSFMQPTLTTGTRRLPAAIVPNNLAAYTPSLGITAEEMQLMANLVGAQIPLNPPLSKGEASISEQGDFGGGIPLPIPLTLGALAFARRKEDGSTTLTDRSLSGAEGTHYTVQYEVEKIIPSAPLPFKE